MITFLLLFSCFIIIIIIIIINAAKPAYKQALNWVGLDLHDSHYTLQAFYIFHIIRVF
jgi:hypothetical protein